MKNLRVPKYIPGLVATFLRRILMQEGHSLVSLSLVLPVLTTPLLAVLEFGPLFYASIEVSSAARAGAAYGAQNLVTAADVNSMESAATNDASDINKWSSTTLTANATQYCVCSDGTSTICANAASNCASPSHPLEYVQVNTQAVVNPLFSVPGLPKSYRLSGQATMRVE